MVGNQFSLVALSSDRSAHCKTCINQKQNLNKEQRVAYRPVLDNNIALHRLYIFSYKWKGSDLFGCFGAICIQCDFCVFDLFYKYLHCHCKCSLLCLLNTIIKSLIKTAISIDQAEGNRTVSLKTPTSPRPLKAEFAIRE